MASVFRKTAMERLASPDRLDCMLIITSPLSWLGIVAALLISVTIIVWSIFGKIPDTVSAVGFIVNNYNTNTLYSSVSGMVSENLMVSGKEVSKGEIILKVRDSKGKEVNVISEQSGIISEILVPENGVLTPNMEIARISSNIDDDMVLVSYVGLDVAKQLREGMEARVRLDIAGSEDFGYMQARIINIDTYISSGQAMNEILGSDGQMAAMLTARGSLVAVSCELEKDINNDNGYFFSNKRGGKIDISGGEQANVQFTLDKKSPISRIFPMLGGK